MHIVGEFQKRVNSDAWYTWYAFIVFYSMFWYLLHMMGLEQTCRVSVLPFPRVSCVRKTIRQRVDFFLFFWAKCSGKRCSTSTLRSCERSSVSLSWISKLSVFYLQYTNAIASYGHVCLWLKVNLNNHGAVDFFLVALRWILAGNLARLVEHVWCHATNISANKHLKNSRLVIAGQSDNGKPVATSILDGTAATFGLVPGSMLLLWLRNYLQLDVSIVRTGNAVQWRCWLPFVCYACDCTSPNKSNKRRKKWHI